MFKKSIRKIVVAIMSILTLLWIGTLAVIYITSYFEIKTTNVEMLEEYAALYNLNRPDSDFQRNIPLQRRDPYADTSQYKLSTFYSVAIAYDGEIFDIVNDAKIFSDKELIAMAQNVQQKKSDTGVINKLIYYSVNKEGYRLVSFIDNTILRNSMNTLFRYTLVFGCIALMILYFLAVYLARKIVQPLEESYHKQKQFISDAGHELKTPVSIVNANAELLFREIGNNQWLMNIQYENERMGRLVEQLLELARTENVVPVMEYLDFSRLVFRETLPFESIAFEKGLILDMQITEKIYLSGNRIQLSQLVSILVDNAIMYGQHGKEVTVKLMQSRNIVFFSVSNAGTVIPPEKMEQLFERFYRMDQVRNGEDKHYGLGLAIAKAIVTAHKGKIGVTCKDGIVTFEVQFQKPYIL